MYANAYVISAGLAGHIRYELSAETFNPDAQASPSFCIESAMVSIHSPPHNRLMNNSFCFANTKTRTLRMIRSTQRHPTQAGYKIYATFLYIFMYTLLRLSREILSVTWFWFKYVLPCLFIQTLPKEYYYKINNGF